MNTDNIASLCGTISDADMMKWNCWSAAVFIVLAAGCEELDDDPAKYGTVPVIPLDNVARMLSSLPIGNGQLREVHDAVSASSVNGYDEEYMMRDLFLSPGSGVGDGGLAYGSAKGTGSYDVPMRDLIMGHLNAVAVRSGEGGRSVLCGMTPEQYAGYLETSDIQIYWPYSDMWDGETFPVITFDPMDGATANVGYLLGMDEEGNVSVTEMTVDESVARERPVWVVNRNDDSMHMSLEMLRRDNPSWGIGGNVSVDVKGSDDRPLQTLYLKDFTMKRHYDSWFGGASEFFVKMGSVESFTASTEAELRLYSPQITDFMIVVKRKYLGQPRPYNVVLVSDWTEQLTHCAFMVTEDDGGTITSWKCAAMVKYNSKSYGFEVELPLNIRDDIVWRGQLNRKFIIANNGKPSHFGDVDITFEIVEN